MTRLLCVLLLCFCTITAHAAELVWDAQTITSPLTVERSATQTGTYTTVATLPNGTTRFMLTPGAYGFYRVRNSAGPSNSVQFSADLYTGLVTDRLTALETRVAALEAGPVIVPPPAPISNLTTRMIDADRIEIVGGACLSLRTTGTGLRRIVECVH